VSDGGDALFDENDPEFVALREFGRRVVRVRGTIAGVCCFFGLAFGVFGYMLLRSVQLKTNGVHVPMVTGALGFAPPFAISLALASWLGKRAIRSVKTAWIDELAKKHQVAPERLAESLTMWD
jgi:hypothetical protein